MALSNAHSRKALELSNQIKFPQESNTTLAHHDFVMDFQGVPYDSLKPNADIRFSTGVAENAAGAVKPSLTDEEAIALWDKLTSTIRVRPTTGVKTSQAPLLKAPLGELAATGRLCPQTGWWDCAETSAPVRGGRRQFFHAGDPMPDAVLSGKPSLLQRVKGDAPTYRTATVWELVDYEAPAAPPASLVAQVPAQGLAVAAAPQSTGATPPSPLSESSEPPPADKA